MADRHTDRLNVLDLLELIYEALAKDMIGESDHVIIDTCCTGKSYVNGLAIASNNSGKKVVCLIHSHEDLSEKVNASFQNLN